MRVELLLLALLVILPSAAAEAGHSAEDELAEALLDKYDTAKTKTLNEAALIAMIKNNTLTTASFKDLPAENHTAHAGHAHSEEDELAEALLKKYGAADKMTEAQVIAMIKANALTTASFKALPQGAADPHAGHDHGHGAAGASTDEALADKLLALYDADKTKTLKESELIAMIKANALTRTSFSALPADAHAGHDHGGTASAEEKVADALLDAYDTDKNKVFSEAELIAMISANKLATASFSVLAQEALADTLLDKYDADKTKALKESELIAMIKANKMTTASFSGLPADPHAGHDHGGGAEEKLADTLLDAYDADKTKTLNEAELIVMIKASTLTTKSFSMLAPTADPHAGHDHVAHSDEDELAEALLGRYDADKTKALSKAEIINMIKGNALTSKTFPALPVADAHAGHDHGRLLAGTAHNEEEELAEALLLQYDAAPKTGTLNEAELIVMIKANKLTTKSFPTLKTTGNEEKLADAMLGKYDANKDKALNEAELISMITLNKMKAAFFTAIDQKAAAAADPHAGHDHGRLLAGDTAKAAEEVLADALLDAYDADKSKSLNEAELIVMITANKMAISTAVTNAFFKDLYPVDFGSVAGLAIFGTLITCLASLAGALVVLPMNARCRKSKGVKALEEIYGTLAAMTTGVLLGAVFVHILPEANTLNGNPAHDWVIGACFLAGVFFCFLIRFGINSYNTENAEQDAPQGNTVDGSPPSSSAVVPVQSKSESALGDDQEAAKPVKIDVEEGNIHELSHHGAMVGGAANKGNSSIVVNIIVGDCFHNLSDGLLIAVAFGACPELGWLVVASILLHELPQEILDFAMLISTGLNWKWALFWNFMSSLSALLACIVVLAVGSGMSSKAQGQILGFGSGTLTFIALSECFELFGSQSLGKPQVQFMRAVLMLFGIGLMGLMQLFHPECFLPTPTSLMPNATMSADPHAGHNH